MSPTILFQIHCQKYVELACILVSMTSSSSSSWICCLWLAWFLSEDWRKMLGSEPVMMIFRSWAKPNQNRKKSAKIKRNKNLQEKLQSGLTINVPSHDVAQYITSVSNWFGRDRILVQLFRKVIGYPFDHFVCRMREPYERQSYRIATQLGELKLR